jgi:predicted LPLAT superfamily acyltransferase
MKAAWLAQPEHGSALAIELIAWISLTAGRQAGRVLLYPICFYFAVFSRRARAASKSYFMRLLGRQARFREIFRHYHVFASTILDRLYLLSSRVNQFKVSVRGEDALRSALAGGRGCILLGSHLGSFEILRVLGAGQKELKINVVMHVDNAAKLNRVFDRLNPEFAQRVIAPGKPETLLRVKECLERNEIVGILGDRIVSDERTVNCQFLGAMARFPQGPLRVAAILSAPVVLFFGLNRGDRQYEIVFEPLCDPIELEGKGKELDMWVRKYVARLEHYTRLAPYNWFNFYDFWHAND